MKRWFYIGGGVVFATLILIIIGLYYLFSSLNSIVKAAVEKYGSDMTQAVVRLNEVDIELSSGRGALRGLNIGNPPGFKSERALGLGEISLQLDVGSVAGDTIVIKEIAITAPEVTYEVGLKGNNIDTLKRNVDAYTTQGKDKGKADSSKEGDEAGKKMIVDHLYVRNGKVSITATEFQGKSASASLPEIHLTDIGKKRGGATAAELTEQVLAAIGGGAAKAAASTELGRLLGSTKMGDVPGAVGEAAKGGGETFKKLFGK